MVDRFVTDTHPFIWFAADMRRKLSRRACAAFDAYEAGRADLYVPAPVLVETWFLAGNGTIKLETTFGRWWRDLANPRLVCDPMPADDVLAAAELNWEHRDPFDRLIVAAAHRLGLPLVTADTATMRSTRSRW